MKKLFWLIFIAAFGLINQVSAYDCQSISTAIGDEDVFTFHGITFARPFEFDFAPTNAPSENAYAADFQLIYKNDELSRATEANTQEILDTSIMLNECLKDFLDEQYVGADYGEFLSAYFSGALAKDIIAKFPAYMSAKLAETLDDSADDTIHFVALKITARGALREALLEKRDQDGEE